MDLDADGPRVERPHDISPRRGTPPDRPSVWGGVRRRLFLLVALVLVPTLTLQALLYGRRVQERVAQEVQANVEVARAVGLAFGQYVHNVGEQAGALGIAVPHLGDDGVLASEILREGIAEYPTLLELDLVGPDGVVVASSADRPVLVASVPELDLRAPPQGQAYRVSDLIRVGPEREPVFTIQRPLRGAGGVLHGVLVAVVDPDRLHAILPMHRSGAGGVSLLDARGRLVYRSPHTEWSWSARHALQEQPEIQDALAGHVRIFEGEIPGSEGQRLGAVVPVEGLDWVAAASRPRADILRPVIRDLALEAGLLVLVGAAAILGALLLARSITRPLARLRQYAWHLAAGEAPAAPEPGGPRELEDLAAALGRMAREVRLREVALEEEQARVQSLAAARQESLERQEQLGLASATVLAETRPADLLDRIVAAARAITGARQGRFYECGQDGSRAWPSPGLPEELAAAFRDLDAGHTLRLRRDQLRDLEAVLPPGHPTVGGLLAVRVTGLGAGGHIVMVTDREDGRDFTAEDEALLGQLAHLASLALRHIEARAAAEQGRLVLDILLAHVPQGLAVVDAQGRVQATSRHDSDLARLLLSPGAEGEVPLEGAAGPVEHPLARVLRGETLEREELRLPASDLVVECTAVPTRDASGRVTGAVLAWWDVTHLRSAEEALRREKAEAIEASEAKSQFLARMSHEIRTPLNALIGMSHLLRDTELDADQREYLETIHAASEHLFYLVDDILDIARIEAGVVELDDQDFQLWETLEKVAEMLALKAHEKGLEFCVSIPADVPRAVRGDEARLRQVLVNLLGNALKYTDQGEVTLAVSVLERRAEGCVLRFDVTDTGVGIPAERLGSIFERFSRGDTLPRRRVEGVGLGLAISRQIVERMGGRIGVSSTEGRGSDFWFTVPLGDAKTSRSPQPAPLPPFLQRALVRDARECTRRNTCAYLEALGLEVVGVRTLEEARDHLVQAAGAGRRVDVFLDVPRPGDPESPDLAEVAREVGTRRVPVVTLDGARRHRRGGDPAAFLVRPVTPGRLQQVLDSFRREGSDEDQAARGDEPDRDEVLLLLVEDNATNRKVALAMLEKLGYLADSVEDGEQAVRALTFIDYDLVLMDVRMPVMDGLAATRRIRDPASGVQDSTVPIVALTANATPEERERCFAAGMDGYLAKPVRPQTLGHMVEEMLTRRRQLAVVPPAPPQGPRPVFDPADFLERMGDDVEVARDVLRTFRWDAPAQVQAAIQARLANDLGELVRAAHSLKGVAGQVSAQDLAVRAAALENAARQGDGGKVETLLQEIQHALEDLREPVARFLGEAVDAPPGAPADRS